MAMGISETIMTPGLFPMMDLPTELRLKILSHLLICSEDPTIDSSKKDADTRNDSHISVDPSVAILQTCKRINEEGTPILYSQNKFIICLPLEPRHNPRQSSAFFLARLRWSSICSLTTISFTSNSLALPRANSAFNHRPRAIFTCTGADILSRFSVSDFKYSPAGPDQYMALSLSNWVSTQVMRAELTAFQTELEAMMRPSEEYVAAMADDPAT